MQISRLQIAECAIPLPKILRLGPVEIRTRDYILIRVETTAGVFGEAIGYPRGTPLFETVASMGKRILGVDASMRREVLVKLEQSNIPARAALTRGLSLLDIALWDIGCKQAGLPLFQVLGGFRRKAETTVVAGYYVDQRSIADVVDEVRRLADEGCRRMKIMLKGDDPVFDRKYASAVSEALPGQIGADAHWTWSLLTEAWRLCRDLDEMGLAFLEDPFSATDIKLTHELRRRLRTPIAAGEDVYGAGALSELVSGIDILRVDATTCGGVTGAIAAINVASAAGRTVLPHVFPPLHVHLACAFPNVEGVELIPEQSGADPLQSFLRDVPVSKDGELSPSGAPGVGISIDWDAVARLARRSVTVTADT